MYVPDGGLIENCEKPLILVYYKVRGKLQPIRNLVCYLGLKFYQVFLEEKEQKMKLPTQVINLLKGVRIQKSLLPLLVYDGHYIYDIYPIMAFLCRKFKHEQLLGRDIRQRCRLQQILQIFFARQPNSMSQMFKLSDFAANRTQQQIKSQKKIYYQKFMNESNYLRQICEYIEAQRPNVFVFETITIIDFMFLESCHYMLGMFFNLMEKQKCGCAILNKLRGMFNCQTVQVDKNMKHLQTLKNYMTFMYSQPFYFKNQHYLESKTILCSNFTPQRVRGLRNIWVYNPKFVQ